MSAEKHYIFEIIPLQKHQYRYHICLSHNYYPVIKSIKNKLTEMGAEILLNIFCGSNEIIADMNVKVEELAEILHEHGIDRATIKQTKHMAYSLIERE